VLLVLVSSLQNLQWHCPVPDWWKGSILLLLPAVTPLQIPLCTFQCPSCCFEQQHCCCRRC
jgi:hypothetical protein